MSFGKSRFSTRRNQLRLEQLEQRALLAITTFGPEISVNSTVAGDQNEVAVAADEDGNFVAVWEADAVGGSDIIGQRFNSDGVKVGGEFKVNNVDAGAQTDPAIAMNADGQFVVTWFTGGNALAVRAFDANGSAVSGEKVANTNALDAFEGADVAIDGDGNTLVVWTTASDGAGTGIAAQLFDADGNKDGTEFLVNNVTGAVQEQPSVSTNEDGQAVIVWEDSDTGLAGRRYSFEDGFDGGQFSVSNAGNTPDVGVDEEGDFVVAWDGAGISAQRFDSDANKVGGVITVNSVAGTVSNPAIDVENEGGFLIAWDREDGANDRNILVRGFLKNGTPLEVEQPVTPGAADDQTDPDVAIFGGNHAIIAWNSDAGATPDDVKARLLTVNNTNDDDDDEDDDDDNNGPVVPPAAAFDQDFLVDLYDDVLDRAASQAELDSWLQSGASREDVVKGFLGSEEHRRLVVTGIYQKFLGRTPEEAGLDYWADQLAEHNEAFVLHSILGSTEYYQKNGGTQAGFLLALYSDLLGRVPSQPEVDSWLDTFKDGASRADVIQGFLESKEFRNLIASDLYASLLDRAGEAAGVDYWSDELLGDSDDDDDDDDDASTLQRVQAAFLLSAEYYAK